MGVYVYLDIVPQRIDKQAWADAYDEVVNLLQGHPDRLLRMGTREVEGVEVPVLVRSLELELGVPSRRCWRVVGDLRSRRTAEEACMHRDLGNYAPCEDVEDILLLDEEGQGPTRAFEAKTQGHPYHLALLAAAIVVENRLPGFARVSGDIDRAQAEKAVAWAESVRGRGLALPVSVDPPALRRRLSRHIGAEELVEAFTRLHIAHRYRTLEAPFAVFEAPAVESWFLGELRYYQEPQQLGALRLVTAWLNTSGSLERLCELACRDDRGPRFAPEAFVEALAFTWIVLPEQASRFLERLEPGELDSPDRQMADVFLDLQAAGRHLRVRFESRFVEQVFARVFGSAAPRLAQRLAEWTAKVEAQLAAVRDKVAEMTGGDGNTVEGEAVPAVWPGSPQDLTPERHECLRALAWALGPAGLWRYRLSSSQPQIAEALGAGPGVLRRLIASGARAGNLTLTDEAWSWIQAERDRRVLVMLAMLALFGDRLFEYQATDLIRAILESRELCLHLVELSEDEEIVEELGGLREAFDAHAREQDELGMKQGREEGIKKGREEGLLDSVRRGLEIRFGEQALALMSEVRELHDEGLLLQIYEALVRGLSLEEVRRIWQR